MIYKSMFKFYMENKLASLNKSSFNIGDLRINRFLLLHAIFMKTLK